jgi:hypothetical protein
MRGGIHTLRLNIIRHVSSLETRMQLLVSIESDEAAIPYSSTYIYRADLRKFPAQFDMSLPGCCYGSRTLSFSKECEP